MLSKLYSCAISGTDGYLIEIEVDISKGLPQISIVGLPDAAIKEAKDRVRSAIKNSGFEFPVKRITINLAPADTKKEGSAYDLPIALGILAAGKEIKENAFEDLIIIGELSLDGSIKPIKGLLSMVLGIKDSNKKSISF